MPSLRLTELRATGAFVGLAAFLALTAPGRLRVSRDEVALLVVYGIVGFALVQWLYFVAIERLPIGIGLLLEFTAPVLVALWARLVWHEPVRRRVWAALALALAGLTLVAQVWEDVTLDAVGVAAGLLAAGALATYYLAGEHSDRAAATPSRSTACRSAWRRSSGRSSSRGGASRSTSSARRSRSAASSSRRVPRCGRSRSG